MGDAFIDQAYYLYRKENKQKGLWVGSHRDPLEGDGEPAQGNLCESLRNPYRDSRGESCTTPTSQEENALL